MRALFVLILVTGCSNSSPPSNNVQGNPQPTDTGSTTPPPPKKDASAPVDAGFKCDPPADPGSFYSFSATDLAGTRKVSMCEYRGKVVLVVNTASFCGYTPQYKGLEADFATYESQGFVILGFPCNQFGAQEPGDASDITNFCTNNYGITFPMFAKIDVNGPMADPIYTWLKSQPGGAGDITWNFNKFLLGRDGKLIKRYDSAIDPQNTGLIADIEAALKK